MTKVKQIFFKICKAIWNGRNRFSIFIIALPSIWITVYFIYNSYFTQYFVAVGGWVIVIYGTVFGIIVLPVYIITWLIECWLKKLRIPRIISDRFFWALIYGFILINLIPTIIILLIFILVYLGIVQ